MALFFGDRGAVGRIPYLVPVTWDGDEPRVGVDGKAPETLEIKREPNSIQLGNLVQSDTFDRSPDLLETLRKNAQEPKIKYEPSAFPLAWQWNHYPDNKNWSLHDRPGWLRLTSSRVDDNLQFTRNILTQRVFGPECSAVVKLDASALRNGDRAGLTVFQRKYGCVGVEKRQDKLFIVQREAIPSGRNLQDDDSVANEEVEVEGDEVEFYFKIACNFQSQQDLAWFYWSLDGREWKPIGKQLHMVYTLPHFMGYRFGLYMQATEQESGYVDFDEYLVEPRL